VAFNDAPSIRAITDISIPSGSTSTNVAFGVDDSDSATVKVTATSSDETLVRNSNIRIFRDQAGTQPAEDFFAPGNRWIRVTSEVGKRGTATITVTATDGAKSSTRTFTVSVVESRERGFVNNRPIAIRDNASADPYPSIITVTEADLVGDVSQVKVRLNGVAHGFPSDVDVLLVSPSGKSVMLMSDAGGGNSITNVTLTFSDSASDEVPAAPPLSSREYRPRNYDPVNDAMPSPAPAAPFGTTLGSLIGTSAAGEWKLYVVDDTTSDFGVINGGWELFITSQPRIVGLADITIKEDQEFSQSFTIVEESFAEPTFTFTTTSTNAAVIRTNDLVFRGSGTNWTITGKPVENVGGVTRITVNARNNYAQTASSSFTVTVSTENDRPFITPVGNLTITSGTASSPVAFSYGDAETPQKDLTFTVSSSNQELVPTNNVFVLGGFLTIAPVGSLSGRSEISLTVTDPSGLSDSTTFTVTVTPSVNAQFANAAAITIPTQGKASPYPSTIEVSRIRGTVSRVTVTLAQLNHPYPSDVDVLLVGPQGQKVVLMSDAGGSERLTNVRFTFDDRAAAGIPINPSDPVPTGTYKPTNHQGVDDFPDAPAGTISANLDAFNGTSPNGTWSLYVVDDASPDGGSISGGWILNIFSTDPTISVIEDQVTNENVPLTVAFRVEDADTASSNLVVAASSDNPSLLGLALSGTGNDRTLVITPTAFASGSGIVTVGVTDGQTLTETSFAVTVNAVNQVPVITGLTDKQVPSNVTLAGSFQGV
jgi:subtilisin-like proprotein convertase family protein